MGNAIVTNRGLLRYPVVSPLDAIFGKFIIEFMTMLIVGVLLTGGITDLLPASDSLDPLSALAGFTLAGMIGLGTGTINCVLFGLFPTWRHVWSVLTRPLFVLSGAFFIVEAMSRSRCATVLFNPLVHAIALVRKGFYASYDPYYVSYPYVLGIRSSLFTIGAYLLRRYDSWLLDS